MPLSDIQLKVVKVLRSFRSTTNYVGGGAALNRRWSRISDDLDIYTDLGDLPESARRELAALRREGFGVREVYANDLGVEAVVSLYGYETLLQWMHDPETSTRFFAVVVDDDFGFRLHEADNAVNKVLCASRRQNAARDAADLVQIVEEYAPLGPLVWAACGKDQSLTPPKVIQGIRRNAFGYADEEFKTLSSTKPITRDRVRTVLTSALEDASAYCEEIAPAEFLGSLFVNGDEIPIEATVQQLEEKTATAMPLRQFAATPIVRTD
jgi:hypothetical protein